MRRDRTPLGSKKRRMSRPILVLCVAVALSYTMTPVRGDAVGHVAAAGRPCRDCQSQDCYRCAPCEPSSPGVPYHTPDEVPTTPPDGDSPIYESPADVPEDVADAFDAATDPGDATSSLPSGLGAVAAAQSPAMHMIGDFFSSGYFLGEAGDATSSLPIAAGDRRFKATDNLSPFPQDRVFFNYHHFHNAVTDINQIHRSVDRYTFGLEKTFFDSLMSLELRVPFAGGLRSVQAEGRADTTGTEFGNMALTLKALLVQRGCVHFSGGLATVFPTADDAEVLEVSQRRTVLRNDAVHLQPYLGINFSHPCRRLFATAYVAVDVDVNGNELLRRTGSSGPLTSFGDVRDQTQLFFDGQIGYWLYRDCGHVGYLNGIAPVIELHYSQQVEDPVNDFFFYQNPFGRANLLNLTAGLVFDFRNTMRLAVYGAAPLRRELAFFDGITVSPVFQAEFGAQCIYRF